MPSTPCETRKPVAGEPARSDLDRTGPPTAGRSEGHPSRREVKRSLGSCLVSFVLHCLILLLLAYWGISAANRQGPSIDMALTWQPEGSGPDLEGGAAEFDAPTTLPIVDSSSFDPVSLPPSIELALPTDQANRQAIGQTGPLQPEVLDQLNVPFERPTGGGWEGRGDAARQGLVAAGGGSGPSEGAVTAGLEWLQSHQHENGSWTFGFGDPPCKGRCRNSSDMSNTTGATGLALLCFLGRNHTHQNESPYRKTVEKGIYYLLRRIKPTPHGGDLQEGTMYAQAIATLALCEAYGLSHDESLRDYAQSCVDFICYAQHDGGGWRYAPGQQGDTTVFGWQLMALKSAKMAGLRVPTLVTHRARGFLDTVAAEQGAFYGYLQSGKEPTPTAVGLLCRMYTGWPRNHEPLRRGVEYLAARGPSKTDMYFNYYATQVMFHYRVGGWSRWNRQLSGYLVRTQAQVGHELGSWYFDDRFAREAGRHYVTCLAIMILEVYYRHMPLYGDGVFEKSF